MTLVMTPFNDSCVMPLCNGCHDDFWSAQVAPRWLLCASALCNLLCAGCSAQAAALCASFSAQVLPELSGSTSHPSILIEQFHYAAGVRSCRTVLRVLQLYLKVAIFQPELRPRTTFALKSCDSCLEKLPRTRRGSTPRPRDSESSRANHATTSKDHFASNKFARRRSESASTSQRVARAYSESKNPQCLHIDHADPRRGFILECQNRKNPQFFDLHHTDLRRGSLAQIRNRSFLTSTKRISEEG